MKAGYSRTHTCINTYVTREFRSMCKVLAQKHNISMSAWIRMLMTDALVDEGFDLNGVRCIGSQRYSKERERNQACGSAAPRRDAGADDQQTRESVDS